MKICMTKEKCWKIIKEKRWELHEAIRRNHGDVNHPNLKVDNAYLDRMVLEYMFYFDEKIRIALLKKPRLYLSLNEVKEMAHKRNISIESDDRKTLIQSIQRTENKSPCYATRGGCDKKCAWGRECVYEFFKELEKNQAISVFNSL